MKTGGSEHAQEISSFSLSISTRFYRQLIRVAKKNCGFLEETKQNSHCLLVKPSAPLVNKLIIHASRKYKNYHDKRGFITLGSLRIANEFRSKDRSLKFTTDSCFSE